MQLSANSKVGVHVAGPAQVIAISRDPAPARRGGDRDVGPEAWLGNCRRPDARIRLLGPMPLHARRVPCSVRRAVEGEEATTLQDSVHDRVGQVVVVQDLAPVAQR